MAHSTAPPRTHQINRLRAQFGQADGLPFADVWPAARLEQALAEEHATWRKDVWTPLLTLGTFLGQVISPDGSCRAAVARTLAWLVARDEPPCRPQTGPYCKARQRLPVTLLPRLTRETGQTLAGAVPPAWRWRGRCVKIADGSTLSMPDTPANQAAYPQSPAQRAGLGFPMVRIVVVFCLACGTVLDAALGTYAGKQTGETALLRGLTACFAPGDVLLADRFSSGYCDIAFWQQQGVDVVVRLHQRRTCDLRRGRKLGRNDHVVTWARPAQRPDWLDESAYAAIPATLTVREVRVPVAVPGFRTQGVVVVTTLLDPQAYRAGDLADLDRQRWHAELDLRSLKATLGMDVLRCQTPAMVRQEIWAHLLAYNLIRTVMAQAAATVGSRPRDLSFKGALQTLSAFAERLPGTAPAKAEELHDWLLIAIATHGVGDRPNRSEPRARKRRPKEYPLLMQPRATARKQLGAKA